MAIEVYHGYQLIPSDYNVKEYIFTDLVYDGFNGGQVIENNTRDKAVFNISLVGDTNYYDGENIFVNFYARGYVNDPELEGNLFEFGLRERTGGSDANPKYKYNYYFENFEEYNLYNDYGMQNNSFPLLSKEINNGDILYIEELRILRRNINEKTFYMFSLIDKNEEENNTLSIKEMGDIDLNQQYLLNLDFNSIGYYNFKPEKTATYIVNLEDFFNKTQNIYPAGIIYNSQGSAKPAISANPSKIVCGFLEKTEDFSLISSYHSATYSSFLEADKEYKICFKRAGYYTAEYNTSGAEIGEHPQNYESTTFILERLEFKINYHLSKNITIQKIYFSNNIALESFNNLKEEGNLIDREDWNFLGWARQNNSDESQYNDAAELELSATETEIDLYAIYDKDFIVTFYTGEENENKYSLIQNYILNNQKENSTGIPQNLEFIFPDAENLDLKINNNFELGDNRIFTSYNYWSKDDNSDWVPLGEIESCENGEIYYLVYNRQDNNNLTITYRKNDGGSLEVESNYFKDVYTNDQFYINKKLQEIKFIIKNNSFKRTNYIFVEWNTAQDGSGTSYKPGQEIPFTLSSTLYAIWKIAGVQNIFYCRNGKYDISPSYLDNIYYCKEGKWYPAKMEKW